jgi:hypothetical protein
MKKIIYLILVLSLVSNGIAQKNELGSVTLEELNQKNHPKDTAAVACILFEKGKTYFNYSKEEGFYIITEVEIKIKIYKKEGYNWANKAVEFYSDGKTEELVSFSKATTYNLIDGKIEKTKLKSEGEFIEKENKYWSLKKITMPNIKEGSIIEYKYSIKSPFISTFPKWNFQYEIPVNYSEYKTQVPEYYTYNVYRRGAIKINETKSIVSRNLILNNTELVGNGMTMKYQNDTRTINYNENNVTYKVENCPSLRDESYVNNIDNYKSGIYHELSIKKMPESNAEYFATSWEDVVRKIYENEDFGTQIKKDNYYEEDIKTIKNSSKSMEEKAIDIFHLVQNRMTWNKFNGYLCNDGVKKAYQEKTGNASEINLMLVSMLKEIGLNASPVLISTRSNGISLFPSRSAFNFVLASVTINDKITLFDATNKISGPNILPYSDLNWFGQLIKEDGTSETIDLMPNFYSENNVTMLATIDVNGEITGKVKENYTNYFAMNYMEKNLNLNQDNYLEKLEQKYNGIEISNFELTNNNSYTDPIVEKYDFKSTNLIDKIDQNLFIYPLLFLTQSQNPFKQETREYPIDFTFPIKNRYMINLTIPDGYQVDTLPSNISFSLPNNYGSFNITISSLNNKIQIISNFIISTSIIPSDDYNSLKEFFRLVIEKQKEKIVLKKI